MNKLRVIKSAPTLALGMVSIKSEPTLALGMVKDSGSSVVCVSLHIRANSIFLTSQLVFGITETPWCRPSGVVVAKGNKWGNSVETSKARMLFSPYKTMVIYANHVVIQVKTLFQNKAFISTYYQYRSTSL